MSFFLSVKRGATCKKIPCDMDRGVFRKLLLTHSAASIVVVVVFNWMGLNKMIQVRCILL